MSEKVLIIAAHPDDEVLGCGGTIARHVREGDEVRIVIVAEGVTSRNIPSASAKNQLAKLRDCARHAASIMGAMPPIFLGLPDNKLDSIALLEVIKPIEAEVREFAPRLIYTHHGGDLNIDHRVIHAAVVTACRPSPENAVDMLLCFEIASSTDWQVGDTHLRFSPNWSVDISSTLATKLTALQAYEPEMRPWPHARSVIAQEHLARWRGASVGVEAAEAFMLARRVVR